MSLIISAIIGTLLFVTMMISVMIDIHKHGDKLLTWRDLYIIIPIVNIVISLLRKRTLHE